jgi:hypothetical protein
MNKLISFLLIFSLTVQLPGCYTFQSVDNFNQSNLNNLEDKDIKISLIDGREIYSESYHHTFVKDTSHFVLVCGKRYKKSYKQLENFKGKLYPDQFKSVTKDETSQVHNLLLNNEDIILVKDVDYLEVTPETEKGFLIWKDGTKMIFNFQEITSIEVDELNVINTVLFVSAGVLLIGLIAASSAFPSH